jgi:sugar transferase (PEP-CTERM system associated)
MAGSVLKIFNLYIPFRKLGFFLLESFLIYRMIILAIYLRFYESPTYFRYINSEYFILKSLLIVLIIQGSLYYFDLYNFRIFRNNLQFILRLFQALGVSSIFLATLYYFIPELIIGRGIFFLSLGFIVIIITLWRILYNFTVRKKQLDEKALIIGTGSLARAIAKTILDRMDTGFSVIGFISDDPAKVGTPLVNPSIIGDYSQLMELVKRKKPDRIVVAMQERRGRFPISQLIDCKMQGITIEEGISFYEHLTGRIQIDRIRPSALIFSDGFKKPKSLMFIKRITELFISIVGLILLSPLILLIALLIKLESSGPVFYRQERVGENSKVFKLIKFRSMIDNAEEDGPVWAKKEDTRITRVGSWLRKLRLDEIPQMLNVLKGDMSFVGPRPERPFFVKQLEKEIPYYDQRHTIKPGITGWAQIKYSYGASKEDALEKLAYDFYYMKNLSFLFDLIIIFETIKVILFGKGAR